MENYEPQGGYTIKTNMTCSAYRESFNAIMAKVKALQIKKCK
jgi:hypothetical protein